MKSDMWTSCENKNFKEKIELSATDVNVKISIHPSDSDPLSLSSSFSLFLSDCLPLPTTASIAYPARLLAVATKLLSSEKRKCIHIINIAHASLSHTSNTRDILHRIISNNNTNLPLGGRTSSVCSRRSCQVLSRVGRSRTRWLAGSSRTYPAAWQ